MEKHSRILQRLEEEFSDPVRDPLWKHVYLSRGLLKIMQSPYFQKLDRIRQLGPTYLVYPGATHSRLSHSIGVFALGLRILRALLRSPDCPPLSAEGARSFLCACFLHDLGHFPYTHSLKNLPLLEHEELTGRQVRERPLADLIKQAGASAEMTAAIVDEKLPSDNQIHFYRHILSGALDPDKLDYLNRDAFFCGVPYGIQDTDFIISQVLPHQENGLALREKGQSALESVLFAKYLMYRNVYWHERVRASTALIKKALFLGMREKRIQAEELYGLDDYTFQQLFEKDKSRFEPFFLVAKALSPGSFHCFYEMPLHKLPQKIQKDLEDYPRKIQLAGKLNKQLGKLPGRSLEDYEIVLDLPGPFSFEYSMPIIKKDSTPRTSEFIEMLSVGELSSVISKSLRKLRVFIPEDGLKEERKKEVFMLMDDFFKQTKGPIDE